MNEHRKYRAWVINLKVMRDVFGFDCNHVYLFNREGEEYIAPLNNEPDECILMQCTGLEDEHGKSIYEGDIINVCCYSYTECEDEAFGQIIDSRFGYALLSEENIIYLNDIQGSYKTIYTVCGNIHDNPSLLKGGRQE